MKVKPVELAGIKRGGHSKDGQHIMFELETRAGKRFQFSCPYEAVGEIIGVLFIEAESALKARGEPSVDDDALAKGTKIPARYRDLTGYRVEGTKDGLMLSLICGPVNHRILLTPDLCTQLSEHLARSRTEWEMRERPH